MKDFGFFFFSKKQREAMREIDIRPFNNYARQLFTGKWNDYRLVAIGFYHHSEAFNS